MQVDLYTHHKDPCATTVQQFNKIIAFGTKMCGHRKFHDYLLD